MTIGDLIKNKDYDYISYRLILPDGDDTTWSTHNTR